MEASEGKTINLNKKEIEFVAENIIRFDEVTEIRINDVEVRILGRASGGTFTAALYRTNDMCEIYKYHLAEREEARKRIEEIARPAKDIPWALMCKV